MSCTKTGASNPAQVKKDFEAICATQREFLEARKLKGVNEVELLAERTRRMREEIKTEPALKAVDLFIQADSKDRRAQTEEAAKAAGLSDWGCPELSEGP